MCMMLSIQPCVYLLVNLSASIFALRLKPTKNLILGKKNIKNKKHIKISPCRKCCFSSSGASSLGWSSKRVLTSTAWPLLSRCLVTSARRSGFQMRKCTSPPDRGVRNADEATATPKDLIKKMLANMATLEIEVMSWLTARWCPPSYELVYNPD